MNAEQIKKELAEVINRNSIENESHTPDFILADYLYNCLVNYHEVVSARSKWYSNVLVSPAEIKEN